MRLLRTTCTLLAVTVFLIVVLSPVLAADADPAALTPEDLLATVPALTDVAGVVATPADWWAGFPQFNGGPANPVPRRGERFCVAQTFKKVDDQEQSRLEVTVVLFKDGKDAHRSFVDMSSETAYGATVLQGPRRGDERRYFARAGQPGEVIMRYRVGPIMGRVSLFSPGPLASAEIVAKYGEALVTKLEALLAGELAAPDLPADFAPNMPPAAATTEIGPILGSAVVPVEAWALADMAQDPVGIRDRLKADGVTNLYYRRYAVQSVPGQVIETTFFQFNDAVAATRWVRRFIRQVAMYGPVYDPGDTGILRAFTQTASGGYELQFTKGRLVGDATSLAPFVASDPAAMSLVRKTVELWWNAVPLQ